MKPIPNFSAVPFASAPQASERGGGEVWRTPEGIAVKAIYGPDDLAGLDFLDGWPGAAPYPRGPYPTMYVNQPWTVRQYAGFSTAEDSNAFIAPIWRPGRRACRSPSISPPIAAMIPTIRASPAMSAWRA